MTRAFRALVVDDEKLYAEAIGRELGREGVSCDLAFSARAAMRKVESGLYQLILLDHRLPDDDGIRMIPWVLARQPGAALIVMTAYDAIPNAVLAIRQGAEDYIVKETSISPIVQRVGEVRRRHEIKQTRDDWKEHRRGGLLGRSEACLQVVEQLRKLARSPETTVLLTGETGVGKEVAARYLHQITGDSRSPMIAVDCLTVPANLAESLLFGHEKGAFTGAARPRVGAFENARDGTVFLDEIGDLGELQGKMLRVLESRTFQRLGSSKQIPLRARVVAATNRDLLELVEQGEFRRDLYERLAVYPIHIPPLRERGEDIQLLAEHFLSFFSDKLAKNMEPLPLEVQQRLTSYDFPGNVRELKNIIERAVINTESSRIELRHLPERMLQAVPGQPLGAPFIPLDFVPGVDSLEILEKRMIKEAMRRAGSVKAQAARLLGISRYQLLRRMEKYELR